MNTLQYELDIKNNEIISETGSLFKAGMFNVIIKDTTYTIDFKRINHDVFYIISNNTQEIAQLIHPDYAPECTFEKLNTHLNTADAQTLFAALCKANVCIEKDYLAFLDQATDLLFTYRIQQPTFL